MRILQDGSRYLIVDVTHEDVANLWRLLPKGVEVPGPHEVWSKLVDPIMGKPEIAIPADIHTDDHQHRAEFDAVAWFQYASDGVILELARSGWGGDYPADDVARACADHNKEVAAVLLAAESQDEMGFECHVNKERALAWLNEHRHGVFVQLEQKDLTE